MPLADLTSLVSAYNFESSGNLGLDSYGTNNLTNVLVATQTTGKVRNAVHTSNAAGSYLKRASNASLILNSTSWELTCWANFDSLPGLGFYPGIIGKWGPNALVEYLIYFNGDDQKFHGVATADGSTTVDTKSSTGLSSGTWYFFDLYFDYPNTTLHFNINNAAATGTASATLTNTYSGVNDFSVGASGYAAPSVTGKMDSASLWKRLLTADERTALWNSGNGLEYPWNAGTRRRASSYAIR